MENNLVDMSTPTLLRSDAHVQRVAGHTLLSRLRRFTTFRFVAFAFALLELGACSDSLTSPNRAIDRERLNAVMPALTDGRHRLASGITSISTRQTVQLDLAQLEF